jgi:hypothetical protein
MEEVSELIRRYGLEEDLEHVILPVTDRSGHAKRIFLLKRRFMRIMYPEGQYVDYPLAEVIEATVKYPELLLSEALYMMHKEADARKEAIYDEGKATTEREDAVYETGTMTERDGE